MGVLQLDQAQLVQYVQNDEWGHDNHVKDDENSEGLFIECQLMPALLPPAPGYPIQQTHVLAKPHPSMMNS